MDRRMFKWQQLDTQRQGELILYHIGGPLLHMPQLFKLSQMKQLYFEKSLATTAAESTGEQVIGHSQRQAKSMKDIQYNT